MFSENILAWFEDHGRKDLPWQQNPTRWCSTGNLVATLKIVEPDEVKLFSYVAAMDPQGASLVSQAALAMR